MTLEEFKATLEAKMPPQAVPAVLVALWHDGRGDWHKAHDMAQEIHTPDGSLIHAYLHRKEGDLSNASYWYSRAGANLPHGTLEEEWDDLVNRFLGS